MAKKVSSSAASVKKIADAKKAAAKKTAGKKTVNPLLKIIEDKKNTAGKKNVIETETIIPKKQSAGKKGFTEKSLRDALGIVKDNNNILAIKETLLDEFTEIQDNTTDMPSVMIEHIKQIDKRNSIQKNWMHLNSACTWYFNYLSNKK